MKVTIAASQMACSWDSEKNIEKAINIVHESADQGAQIILLQELFEASHPSLLLDRGFLYYLH